MRTRQVSFFEPDIDAWSIGVELPRVRNSHVVLPVDGRLIVLSGNNDEPGGAHRETAVYYIT